MSSPKRIMVVENEGATAHDLLLHLRKLGYEVPPAVQSGEKAIAAAREHRPELVLMDARPGGGIDGMEVSARITENFQTPVILLTSYAADDIAGEARSSAPVGFILKPLNEPELHTAIQIALDKHQAEVALRRNERFLAGMLRGICDAIIAVDLEMNVLFLNDVAAKMTRWSETAAAGQPLSKVYRIVDPITGALWDTAAVFRSRSSGISKEHREETAAREGILIAQDGSPVQIEENSAPILDEEGNAAGAVLVFRDISKRRQAEATHRGNEEQLRSLANSICHLAWMAEPDGNIFWFNERWYQYTGTCEEEMRGWGWQSVHDPAVLPEVRRRWKKCLETGSALDMEFPLRGVTGQYRWFLTRVTPVKNAEGNVVRWFGTNTDIHEAREVREQLQRANASLAQFAYSASHDLREPVRNVKIYSQLLGKKYAGVLDEQGAEFLGYITEGATRLETLVSDLLAYAESGRASQMPLEWVEAGAVLEDAIAGLGRIVGESGAKIDYRNLPKICTRRVHLRQLFQNLLENAIKFRGRNTPVIEVTAEDRGLEWVFAVKDNGIGIDEDYRESVFGLFRRLHAAKDYEGTGLGLALCQNVVGMYGGRIWVESEPGQGSTFFFALPR